MQPFHILDYISIYKNACQPIFFSIFKNNMAYYIILSATTAFG
jgi:hypothetical protein